MPSLLNNIIYLKINLLLDGLAVCSHLRRKLIVSKVLVSYARKKHAVYNVAKGRFSQIQLHIIYQFMYYSILFYSISSCTNTINSCSYTIKPFEAEINFKEILNQLVQ